MSYLKVEHLQTSCVFVLQIEDPTDTLRRLALFFQDNSVVLHDFNLHRYQDGTAMVIVHCLIDKQLLSVATEQLSLLPGILKVDLMEKKQ
jgi:hypothetical protein